MKEGVTITSHSDLQHIGLQPGARQLDQFDPSHFENQEESSLIWIETKNDNMSEKISRNVSIFVFALLQEGK